MFDEMIRVKLHSAMYPQMISNNAGKQFSTDIYNRKTSGEVIYIFQGLL